MIVVSDSTPLITLMKADVLHVLGSLFGEVVIPRAVFSELTANSTYESEADLVRNSDYIKVVTVEDGDKVSFLRRATGLDLGESEAIVYADKSGADLLLMDELAGRKVAQNMNLPVAGSVGIIVKAAQSGILSTEDADVAFEKIRKSHRHISERLLHDAMEIIRGSE